MGTLSDNAIQILEDRYLLNDKKGALIETPEQLFVRVAKYISNFDKVAQKLKEIEARDHIRNFQPPISGAMIMDYFHISPSKIVGEIKDEIKEAILEGKIGNNFDQAFELMKSIGKTKEIGK